MGADDKNHLKSVSFSDQDNSERNLAVFSNQIGDKNKVKDKSNDPDKPARRSSTFEYMSPPNVKPDIVEIIAYWGSLILFVLSLPVSLFFSYVIVQQYEKCIFFRMGKLRKADASGPGMVFYLPCIDEYEIVDLRTASFEIPPQEALTKDSCTIQVDAVVFCHVKDPKKAICSVSNYVESSQLLAASTLRKIIGTHDLIDILRNRETISRDIGDNLDGATAAWGVKVERVEIREVQLPPEMQSAMAAEAQASRDARAKLITAEGEKEASIAIREASNIMAESPAALQLRYLHTLNSFVSGKESTVVFPVPMNFMAPFLTPPTVPAPSHHVRHEPKRDSKLRVSFAQDE